MISAFFRLLTVLQAVGKYHFEQLVAECFCAAAVKEQFRNDGLPVPLCRDDTVGGAGRGGHPVLFCHRRLLSPGAKKGFPVARKIPLGSRYSVLLCECCGGGLRLSPCPVFPRIDKV